MKQCILILVCCLGLFANIGSAFRSSIINKRCVSCFRMASTVPKQIPNPFEQMMGAFQGMLSPKPKTMKAAKIVVDLTQYDDEINDAKFLLINAAKTKKEDGDKVVEALLSLEQLMRKKNKLDEGATSTETLANLNGAWRLIFTTGTIDTQKKLGRKINYFPLKAAQCFYTDSMTLTNGIFLGDFELIKFFGEFEWKEKARKVEFDFDAIQVLGLKFDLPKGGAAKIGAKSGLGSDSNEDLVEKGKKPFFNWISADSEIATARGGGGGLALWQRDLEMQEKEGKKRAVSAVSASSTQIEEEEVVVQKVAANKAVKKAVKEVEPEFLYDDGKY